MGAAPAELLSAPYGALLAWARSRSQSCCLLGTQERSQLQALLDLRMGHNEIGDQGAASFFQTKHQLHSLALDACDIHAAGARLLAAGLSTSARHLLTLDLSHNSLDDNAVTSICQSLATNRTLQTLNLSACALGNPAGRQVLSTVKALRNASAVGRPSRLKVRSDHADTHRGGTRCEEQAALGCRSELHTASSTSSHAWCTSLWDSLHRVDVKAVSMQCHLHSVPRGPEPWRAGHVALVAVLCVHSTSKPDMERSNRAVGLA